MAIIRQKQKVREEADQPMRELISKLAFTPDNVIGAASEQAVLFHKAVELRLVALHNYLYAKSNLATVRAATGLAFRAQAREADERITEGFLEAKVLMDPSVAVAQTALQEAEVKDESAKLLLEAYRMRRDSFKVIGEWRGSDLRAQQAHELGVTTLEEAGRNLSLRYPGNMEE